MTVRELPMTSDTAFEVFSTRIRYVVVLLAQ